MTPTDRATPPLLAPRAGLPAGWVSRHWRLGAVLGLALGLFGQLAVSLGSLELGEGSLFQRGAALLYSAASWSLLAMALALSTRGLLRWRVGRAIALGLSVGVCTTLSVVGLLGVLARVVSGDYLTLQALQFLVGSSDHLLHAVLGPYRLWALAFVLGTLGLGLALGRWLLPAAHGGVERLSRQASLMAVVGVALLGTGFTQRDRSEFLRGMFESGPLLALASSVDASFAQDSGSDVGGHTARLVDPGPALEAGALWERVVEARQPTSRPNVLLLMLESVNARQLGQQCGGRPVTPELDRLAAESRRFGRTWATATHSNYAQMAVLSSLLPIRRTGLDQYEELDYPRVLWHDLLHQLGYDTATISSQDETWQGMRRFQDTGTPTTFWHSRDHRGPHIDIGAELVVPDEQTVDHAIGWLSRARSGPWGLYLNLQSTHFPYRLPAGVEPHCGHAEPNAGTFSYFGYPLEERAIAQRRHRNALAYVDAQVGRLRRFLEERRLLDATVWIVTGDHGEMFGEHGMVTHGRTLYEAEAHVPLYVRWPGHLEPGDDRRQASHIDVLPTIADLLGVPPHPAFQGRSLARGGPDADRPAAFMSIQGLRVAEGLVCYPWKLAIDRTTGRRQLFHLEDDPDERFDRAAKLPHVTRQLYELMAAQRRAQLAYHEPSAGRARARYAPRLGRCPELPSEP